MKKPKKHHVKDERYIIDVPIGFITYCLQIAKLKKNKKRIKLLKKILKQARKDEKLKYK